MTLHPSADLKSLLPQLLGILKQAAQDPDSVHLDMGQAQQVKDALSNLIDAKQQQRQGKQPKSGSSTAQSADAPDDDDDDNDKSQKKSTIIP